VRDNRFIICLILFAILGMIAIAWLIPPVQAYYYVQQGDSVAIGERVDLSGAIGWQDSNGDWNLAYYGRSGSEMDPQYTIKIVKKSDLYNYYIDPAIFGQRLGPWYQFYGNATEDNHGNTLAFRVVQTKNITPFDNTTGENVTVKAPDARPTRPRKYYRYSMCQIISSPGETHSKLKPVHRQTHGSSGTGKASMITVRSTIR
jgi:hypothetical protein